MPAPRRRLAAALALAASLAVGCGRGDLESPDPERRAEAVRALASRAGDEGMPVLLVAQRDASPLVRRAAAEVFASRGGAASAEALGSLLRDPDPGVVETAARGLGAMPSVSRARADLLAAYVDAAPAGRAAIAAALDAIGTSLREAVELESRILWERNAAALADPRGVGRSGAAEELGTSGRAEAVERLLPLVDPNRNPDRELAAAAARGLGEAGDWTARPHLEVLLAEADAALAEAAAAALGRLGDPGAAAALARAGSDATGRVAAAAVDALSGLPEAPEVGVALCALAARATDPAVAARAAREARLRDAECPERAFLARLGAPAPEAALAAIPELALTGAHADAAGQRVLRLLAGARVDVEVRIAAARSLAGLRSPSTAAPVRDRLVALQAQVAEARSRPVEAAPRPAGATPGGGARLAAALARPGEPVPALAGAAGGAGPAGGGIGAVPRALARELGAVAAAAGALLAPGAEPLLVALAEDPDPAIRAGAVEGLAALGTDSGLRAADGALDDPERSVRLAAAAGLGRAGPRGTAALARAAAHAPEPDPGWRVALAEALGQTGSGAAVTALEKLLSGASAAAAAEALGRTGSPAAVTVLVGHLGRPDATGRVEAITSLTQLVARDAADAIAAHLTSDRAEVRLAAARALGRLRHEPASARLEALRSDYDGRVRRAAVEALAKLPSGRPRSVR